MKKFIEFLIILFSLAAMAEPDSECGTAKLNYKDGKETISEEVEICKNEYSQFYAKKCADGCVFLKALKKKSDIELEDSVIGSPGGQICQQLGFESRIVEVEFKNTKTKYVDLCFDKDKKAFVSTGFLRDLKGDLE